MDDGGTPLDGAEQLAGEPSSSSSASGASSPAEAGSAPSMHGVGEMYRPSTTVKLSDTWCPANCHPQAWSPGEPNTLKQYRSGSNRSARSGASAQNMLMAITDTTLVYPGRLVPVTISSCAEPPLPSSSTPMVSPFRSGAGRYDQSRRSEPELEPESEPKAKHALPLYRRQRRHERARRTRHPSGRLRDGHQVPVVHDLYYPSARLPRRSRPGSRTTSPWRPARWPGTRRCARTPPCWPDS